MWPYPGAPATRTVPAPLVSKLVGPAGRPIPALADARADAEWDRAADARRDAWLASPFAAAFERVRP